MTAIPNGAHVLIITTRDGLTARCSCGRFFRDVASVATAREQHDEHLQDVANDAIDQIATDAGIRDGAK